MPTTKTLFTAVILAVLLACAPADDQAPRPNILWLYVEDMNANMGVYGETIIKTPNIDSLAAEGARFTSAFMPAGVCSPTRSALITGMYQTSIGAHNHRSSLAEFRGTPMPNHHAIYLPEHIKPLPEIFREAGYYVANGAIDGRPGKTDYNFEYEFDELYDGADWKDRQPEQPFFAQIQLRGGKARNVKVADPVNPGAVKPPPYYPDHPGLREEYASYLDTVVVLDEEVGQIVERLRTEGILDDTVIFFFTDHGNRMIRDKQFLYDGGIRVPLIVRWPERIQPGTVRAELVSGIDISASSPYLAGIPVPEYMEGRTMFGPDYQPRDYIVAARDRCDYTIDHIRAVRTKQFKYIRNFMTGRPYTQPQYRDGPEIRRDADSDAQHP